MWIPLLHWYTQLCWCYKEFPQVLWLLSCQLPSDTFLEIKVLAALSVRQRSRTSHCDRPGVAAQQRVRDQSTSSGDAATHKLCVLQLNMQDWSADECGNKCWQQYRPSIQALNRWTQANSAAVAAYYLICTTFPGPWGNITGSESLL